VYSYVRERQREGEIPTGLLYLDPDAPEHHDVLESVATPLGDLSFEELCPGPAALEELLAEFR